MQAPPPFQHYPYEQANNAPPLLASALSGVSAIFRKSSVVTLSPLTVLTFRYGLILPVLLAAPI
jgi:hypothetical protein